MPIFILFVVTFYANVTFAWGPKGQTITVKLAESFLTEEAKFQVQTILNNEDLSSYATWADVVRNTDEWRNTAVWHYINIDSLTSTNDPDDIVEAINFCIQRLTTALSSDDRATWLKFLIHLMGDLHQPLHAGQSRDRGGNSVRVSYGGQSTNLHALWDGRFIEKQALSVEKYVQLLKSQNRGQEELRKAFSGSLVVDEGIKLREFVYSFNGTAIDSVYEKKAIKITEERLWTGGLRLASVLNRIFEQP